MTEPAADMVAIEAAESAACPCGHIALDHAWHGCEECPCGKSAVAAFLTSEATTRPDKPQPGESS